MARLVREDNAHGSLVPVIGYGSLIFTGPDDDTVIRGNRHAPQALECGEETVSRIIRAGIDDDRGAERPSCLRILLVELLEQGTERMRLPGLTRGRQPELCRETGIGEQLFVGKRCFQYGRDVCCSWHDGSPESMRMSQDRRKRDSVCRPASTPQRGLPACRIG